MLNDRKALLDNVPSEYFPPDGDAALEEEIALLAAHINAATYRLLCCIRAFDEREIYAEQGFRSTAHWLSWRVGIALGAAREKVRVARALASLPKLSDALCKAEISYSKVRAVTRIARPDIEEELLRIAKIGTASHVEKLVQKYRCATRADEMSTAEAQHEGRYLRTFFDDEGMLVIKGRLPPECGALVQKALDAAQELLRSRATEEPKEEYARLRADALADVALQAMEQRSTADNTSSGDRYQVVVHVSAESLEQPDAPDDECPAGDAELALGPSVPAGTCRRIACDCSVLHLTESADGTPLDVGRKTRVISTALRRALAWRDKGCCRFPGCTNRIVDGHHLHHWADGGETKLSNILNLCRRHHRLVHEGGFRIEGDGNHPRFFAPNGTAPIPSCGVMPSLTYDPVERMAEDDAGFGVDITPSTGFPTWQGEVMSYDWAVTALLR